MKSTFVQVFPAFFAALLLLSTLAGAQTWEWAGRYGADDDETCQAMTSAPGNRLYWAGTFAGESMLGDLPLTTVGENDIFLALFDPADDLLWIQTIGSAFDDEVKALATDETGNLYVTGTYWLEAQLDGQMLTTSRNPKSIFVARYSPDGQLDWARSIDGTGSKDAGGIAWDENGLLHLTGYFSDSLFIGDTVLVARGDTDLFAAALAPDGTLLRAGGWGYRGDVRGRGITSDGLGGAVIGGIFNDSLIIGEVTISSVSLDPDVFFLRLDEQGEPLWLRRAGGVHDQEVTGLAVLPDGSFVAGGYLVGVINLGEGISAESQTGNPDLFLLRYNLDGTPLAARAMGNNLIQQSLDLKLKGEEIIVAGIYQGSLTIDGQSTPEAATFGAFVAGFNSDLQLNWLGGAVGTTPVLSYAAGVSADGMVYTGGTFSQTASFENTDLQSAGKNDAFLARLNPGLTPVIEPMPQRVTPVIYPNPASDRLFLSPDGEHYSLRLFDIYGRLVLETAGVNEIDLSGLAPGWHTLLITNREGEQITKKILITR